MRWWRNQGLNFKVAVGIALTMVVVLGSVFFVLSRYFNSIMWNSEIQKTQNINAIAETLLVDAMMAGHKDNIQEALDQLGQSVAKSAVVQHRGL